MQNALSAGYAEASRFFVRVVQHVPKDSWEAPGLGTWSVIELVGHANRAHHTIIDYIAHPCPVEAPDSSYFSDVAIAERKKQSVALLGEDPAAAVAAASARAIEVVEASPGEVTLGSPVSTTTLAEYLPSRLAELVIHGLDVVHAIGVDLHPPRHAVEESLAFVGRFGARRNGERLLMALAGRSEFPRGYSAY